MAFTVLLRCRDLERGLGRVVHPNALDRKYLKAGEEGGWQWVFRASQNCTDPMTRTQHRQHMHESVIQKAVKESARQSAIAKPASRHTSPIRSPRIKQRWPGSAESGRWPVNHPYTDCISRRPKNGRGAERVLPQLVTPDNRCVLAGLGRSGQPAVTGLYRLSIRY